MIVLLCAASLSLPHCKNDNKSSGSNSSESPNPACSPLVASGFNKGDGTADSPFLICSRSQLEAISAGLTQHYELGQNIDLQNDPFTPLSDPFTGSLDGKSYEIQNLTITVTTKRAGLFAELGAAGSIQNLGIVGLNVTSANTSGSVSSPVLIGALAALMSGGEIKNCYAIANDSDDGQDLYGDVGAYDYVGGLVGFQTNGSIISSYANGDADGGNGVLDHAGGLVGRQSGGNIIGSYATGNADGGEGDSDYAGGLVGFQSGGSIIASYATGDASGGSGNSDLVGVLVGTATGGTRAQNYGFGTALGNADGFSNNPGDLVNSLEAPPDSLASATALTADNAGTVWGGASSLAWDFGTGSETPALKYITGADIGGGYVCVASELPSALSCGDLLAGQR